MYPHPAVIIYFYPRPLRGGRRAKAAIEDADEIFLSTPSARRATITSTNPPGLSKFLSTPSARRATQRGGVCAGTGGISIHALCEEGDLLHAVDKLRLLVISIHALCEEGDARAASIAVRASGFLSTPSARRATPPWCVPCSQRCISIHALCEEGDDAGINTERLSWIFLSTPSARRATSSM